METQVEKGKKLGGNIFAEGGVMQNLLSPQDILYLYVSLKNCRRCASILVSGTSSKEHPTTFINKQELNKKINITEKSKRMKYLRCILITNRVEYMTMGKRFPVLFVFKYRRQPVANIIV